MILFEIIEYSEEEMQAPDIREQINVPYTFAPAHVNKQRAAAVAALGEIYYKKGKTETAAEHRPDYLRLSQAERERMERENAKHA